jgi:hypothetical protein
MVLAVLYELYYILTSQTSAKDWNDVETENTAEETAPR